MKYWALVLVCVLGSSGSAQHTESTSAPRSASVRELDWPREVQGFGLIVDDARQDALKHLVERLAALLERQQPPLLAWSPTIDYVKRQLIVGTGEPGKDFLLDSVGPTKTWVYRVRALDWPDLKERDRAALREQRRSERITWVAIFFASVFVVMAILTIYLWIRQTPNSPTYRSRRL